MKKHLSFKFLLALTLFSLIGQVAWVVENMYLNVFIYNMFSASAGAISLMVGASAVSAAITTVFIGAFSDKIGKLFYRLLITHAVPLFGTHRPAGIF